jgi:hypothetical protein
MARGSPARACHLLAGPYQSVTGPLANGPAAISSVLRAIGGRSGGIVGLVDGVADVVGYWHANCLDRAMCWGVRMRIVVTGPIPIDSSLEELTSAGLRPTGLHFPQYVVANAARWLEKRYLDTSRPKKVLGLSPQKFLSLVE